VLNKSPGVKDQIAALKQAIAAQESLRPSLGDAVVDAAIATLKEKLSALDTSAQQCKQITVLFADVSGFTAMSETMDAEDVSDNMNALWRRVDAAITQFGGHIDKHIGDAVMALWGVYRARENDPEQAIRAALAMQEAIQAHVQASQIPLKMRIGVNTGPVLLDRVGAGDEFTAMGDTVNTASRLEQAASNGVILISHNTYRQVRGVFDVTPQEPLSVKGKAEPLQVYVVERAKPHAFRIGRRGVEGVDTKMVGRDAEMFQIQDAYKSTAEEREVIQRSSVVGRVFWDGVVARLTAASAANTVRPRRRSGPGSA
jgi:class 3 adenylate cyclase